MSYKTLLLNPCLYYVKWFEIPKPNSPLMDQYFSELNAILDSEDKPIFLISDLRDGHIANVHFLLQMARILTHRNYGGGCAFTENARAHNDVSMFNMIQRSSTPKDSTALFDNPEDAIAYLETLESHITEGIDWDEVLSGDIFSS